MGQSFNPYSAPKVDEGLEQPAAFVPLVDASKGARLVNLLVDSFAMFAGIVGLGVFAGFLGASEAAGDVIGWVGMLGYYVGFESLLSATPGKLITRTRVVRLDGSQPSFLQILGRTVVRFIPFEAVSFLLSGDTRGWHDSLSRTRVVYRS
jgi:uncharacterized RDD family membrane protein YckC